MGNVRTALVLATGLALAVGAAAQAGPINRQIVDPVSAARGQQLYATACAGCHGDEARGTPKGVDLMVSSVLLHDRYGSHLGPFLTKAHPVNGGAASTTFTQDQIRDLSNFLYQKFYATLSRRVPNPPPNIVVGNAAAGQAYFNGAGKCATCHSVTGDLAGIAKRDSPYQVQQSVIFPEATMRFGGGRRGRGARAASQAQPGPSGPPPTTVTVTSPGGATVSGDLVHLDDFNVTYKDAAGQEHTLTRTPGMTVTTKDPFAYHIALLKTITDRQMHDVVAYLETLQ